MFDIKMLLPQHKIISNKGRFSQDYINNSQLANSVLPYFLETFIPLFGINLERKTTTKKEL